MREHKTAEFQVTLCLAAGSARRTPCRSGYRPNHKDPVSGAYFMGQFHFDGEIAPGETTSATVTVIASVEQVDTLSRVGTWTLWEGPHYIGYVKLDQ
ncbi:hypothetical protein F6Q07_18795 [Pectobacterium parmentieri]|uniref:Integron gene cassette protein n=1 Tax=Pectobacterium parmentieri TaxID=1905730 RepID=A0A0H3I300_PECPM|nr:hypothetical protein [Pectobacterium parmentieri]AFI88977.1 Putative integron gene cassette protein [Pectobacterium parmentieri]MBI0429513.1 hypothetical protein [Pectobacterium parmentieri]MBI0472648.1 hypothetical protein [Pectobacterium parmentieri]MBI0492500.1 hypothetical protein [Pectobacterium parmentieri]MBI0520162.1 hypothetical protein [Pectobacterium parmentieri]